MEALTSGTEFPLPEAINAVFIFFLIAIIYTSLNLLQA